MLITILNHSYFAQFLVMIIKCHSSELLHISTSQEKVNRHGFLADLFTAKGANDVKETGCIALLLDHQNIPTEIINLTNIFAGVFTYAFS